MTSRFEQIKKQLSGSSTMPAGAAGTANPFMMGSASAGHSHSHHDHDHDEHGNCCDSASKGEEPKSCCGHDHAHDHDKK